MSIVNAILFYSKHNRKSYEMKQVLEEYNVDVGTVSVDSSQTKRMLKNDKKYKIRKIPSIVLLYSNGSHIVYTDDELDNWFGQLIQNINAEIAQQQPSAPDAVTSLDLGTEESEGNEADFMQNDPMIQPTRKEIDKKGTGAKSAAEIAQEMIKAKERRDDEIDKKKPFM